MIVIDDPLKPEGALSQTQRQAASEWYDPTLYSRLSDKLTGAIVLTTMHRLHESLPSGMEGGPRWAAVAGFFIGLGTRMHARAG